MLKPGLQLRTSQHLALTPALQQSIKLLQLSTLELEHEIEQILQENPLLEREDEHVAGALRVDADGTVHAPAPSATATDGERESTGDDADTSSAAEVHELPDAPGMPELHRPGGEHDDDTAPQLAARSASLREHLLEQLSFTQATQRDAALVAALIDELDDNGYLDTSLEELAGLFPPELEIDADELRSALGLLQSFDPAGVGARNISECLCLQLRDPDLNCLPEARDAAVLALARSIAAQHLPLLGARDYAKLRKALGCSDDQLRAAQSLIRRLDPRPGARYSSPAADYVIPDVIVRKVGNQWRATLNGEAVPRLRINQMYAQILKSERSSAHPGLSSQLQEARWLIRNVQQRFDTILRVAQAIIDRQQGFLNHGEVAMRPLVLREIADTLGLHESTISRVTTQKYMLTPLGTFELKYFFGSHVATETGGAASSTAIRALIKQLIGAEDPTQPLSDSQLAQMLGEQGIVVARRTVAKYREALKIPPVSLRKNI
ncbi:RNA polymerase factor sigma-54 [Pigmentiphaga sp. NML080357]|uniref:RNA polymerase factor sigma-54 n=1 Tax=Pigmentiphaga sp. NML080357 TaxID=2008675 RepID=UPI000B4227F7|nr:RNA polymerase factor sigma-54 [Pigmentiphaga sp. NML080357]OVZ59326.1 RNA polymerase factor sigma-54 [Pigmentiphaga sp. NML080357]